MERVREREKEKPSSEQQYDDPILQLDEMEFTDNMDRELYVAQLEEEYKMLMKDIQDLEESTSDSSKCKMIRII